MKVLPLLLVGALAITSPLAAQKVLPSVPQSLSLRNAIELAIGYNPAYRQVLNDRGAAAWSVRNAYASFLPSFNASGSLSYTGSGTQRFLTTEFDASSATLGSLYSLGFNWTLDGRTLMQPGVAKARLHATEAQINSSEMTLRSQIVQQYLTVLQAQAEVENALQQQKRNDEALRLAQARYDVGQATLLEVRQAEVSKGQSDVAVLTRRQTVTIEKLRMFQQMGVAAPEDPSLVVLSDTFPITEPEWKLSDLIADAQQDNPDLNSLRASESSAKWQHRQEKTTWLPSLSLQAGWSGFTQQFTNPEILVNQARQSAASNVAACEAQNIISQDVNTRVGGALPIFPCAQFEVTPEIAQRIRARNDVFPFNFTQQPFSARMTLSLPLWDQFSRSQRVSQAGAAAEDAAEAVRSRELQVRTDVSQAYYQMQTALQTIQLQENNRTAAREQLRLGRERFRIGSGTLIDLLDGQVAAQQAELDYIRAVYDYHRAVASLEAAVGRPLR